MKRLLCAAVLTLSFASRAFSVEPRPRLLIEAPATPLVEGMNGQIIIVFLNESNQRADLPLPQTLDATATINGNAFPLTLQRASEQALAMHVPAQGFAREAYNFTVPTTKGTMLLSLPAGGSATVALEVAPHVEQTAAPAPISPTSTPPRQPGEIVQDFLRGPETAHSGFVEYFEQHFSAHEPIYFVAGNEDPVAKFQLSFKYKVLNDDGPLVKAVRPLGGLYLAYSQTSFWDLAGESAPFFDNSYRPELLFAYDNILPDNVHLPGVSRVGLQTGIAHESNGRDGTASRSINIAYVRPIFVFGDESDFFITVAPRVYAYINQADENADIENYRGYADLRCTMGYAGGLQLAGLGRLGDDWDKGSLQLDLTYPLNSSSRGNVDIYLDAQFFTGFGESLLRYNDSDSEFRIGISLVR